MSIDYSALRTKMVDGQVRTVDVTDLHVLDAMLSVPREEFVPEKLRQLAYLDEDVAVAPSRYLMEPSPFARLLQLAEIGSKDAVLDVGCGTGYSSAVLSVLAGSVTGLECDDVLADAAKDNLARLGYPKAAIVKGSLAEGHKAGAPYDVIFVEGAVQIVPQALLDQLREGGRLIAVEGTGNAAVARVYLKFDGVVSSRRAFHAAVKPLPGFERTAEFVF